MRHWLDSLLSILSRASTWLRYHQEMHIFSSSIVSQNISDSVPFLTGIHCQWYLMGWLLLMPWFRLAYSSYTCRHIGFGTGILLFELRKQLFLYISCLTFFWWLCPFFHRLQGPTRNFLTGYVFFLTFVIIRLDFMFSQSHSIGSVIAIFLGITYWYIWGTWLPKRNGYCLQQEWVNEEDGVSRYIFHRVPRSVVSHSTWA